MGERREMTLPKSGLRIRLPHAPRFVHLLDIPEEQRAGGFPISALSDIDREAIGNAIRQAIIDDSGNDEATGPRP